MDRRRLAYVALVAVCLLVLGAVAAACSGTQRKGGQTTETTTPKAIPTNSSTRYHATLTALNNSGVSGQAFVSVTDTAITVRVVARGLVSGQPHALQIHGFPDRASVAPPVGEPISEATGAVSYGPALLDLEPGLTVRGSSSTAVFKETFDNAQVTFPLDWRAIVIYGITNNGTYDTTMPVAVGLLKPLPFSGTKGSETESGGAGTSGQTGKSGKSGKSGGTGGTESSGTSSGP